MTEEIQNMDQMANALQETALSKGDITTGQIVRIEDGQAIVDVGYKFEGVIPIGELSAVRVDQVSDVVSVGDRVECKVLRINEEEGKLVLSRKDASAIHAWDRLEEQFQAGAVLEVKVADVVKGGLVADVGVRAFIPASLVEQHFVEDFSGYKGRTLRVKIVELNREERKVILSPKAVLEAEQQHTQAETIRSIQPGEIRTGTVERISSFGVFVDIGGVDGLVHISELSWSRVADPAEVVKIGDQVQVKVLRVDPDRGRISLSIKEASPGPWAEAATKFKAGDIVTGTVRRLADFGAFVELSPGVEGLVHVSQIANRRVSNPREALEVGQEVKVKILDVNPEAQRISLSIREAQGDRPRREVKEFTDKAPAVQGTGATLGDLFGDLFKK